MNSNVLEEVSRLIRISCTILNYFKGRASYWQQQEVVLTTRTSPRSRNDDRTRGTSFPIFHPTRLTVNRTSKKITEAVTSLICSTLSLYHLFFLHWSLPLNATPPSQSTKQCGYTVQLEMSSLSRNLLRTSTRSLRRGAPLSCLSVRTAARASYTSQLSSFRAAAPFSTTMIPRNDAVAAPAPPKEFDHEIVDMASYVHHYKVESDLAVSWTRAHD